MDAATLYIIMTLDGKLEVSADRYLNSSIC